MPADTAIKITYWAPQTYGAPSINDFDGIDEFRRELTDTYVTVVYGRPGDLGGGLYQLAIEVLSGISLAAFAKSLLTRAASDVVKHGANTLVLRPLLNAYRRLKSKNSRLDIAELRILFQDTTLVIYQITGDSIASHLDRILDAVAQHLSALTLQSGERPFGLHVPVFEDPNTERLSRFRVLLDVDETIQDRSPEDYFHYWGAQYDFAGTSRVYDVARDLLIDQEFFTQSRYWQEWELRERAQGAKRSPDSGA